MWRRAPTSRRWWRVSGRGEDDTALTRPEGAGLLKSFLTVTLCRMRSTLLWAQATPPPPPPLPSHQTWRLLFVCLSFTLKLLQSAGAFRSERQARRQQAGGLSEHQRDLSSPAEPVQPSYERRRWKLPDGGGFRFRCSQSHLHPELQVESEPNVCG